MTAPRLRLTVQRASRARHIPADATLRRWARAVLGHDAEVTIRYVADREAQHLNRDHRGRDYATNVLTWTLGALPGGALAGDVAICAPLVAREARDQGKSIDAHHAHLVVHALLHLQGWDHERSPAEAGRMERREREILTRLGFPDPYVPAPKSRVGSLC